ncbi:MAG: DoxX family protein [Alphaproteobacteria bacterium]|jgi:putative oxidoreductase|nr:DoxX family protein [Alphaproteobacteria bacterium]
MSIHAEAAPSTPVTVRGLTELLSPHAPAILAAVRVVVALLFMEHGLMKLVGFPAPMPGLPHPLPPLFLAAGTIEVAAGSLITLGLFTRPAAFIASGEMAVAYFMAHAPRGFFPALNQGEPAILFAFIFLYLAAAGGGSWSLDRTLRRR